MSDTNKIDQVAEAERQIPIVSHVDVVVAGGGMAGFYAALAAARNDAKTIIIDRFGALGGNIGPGMFAGGGFPGYPGMAIFEGFTGLVREFLERYVGLGGAIYPMELPLTSPFKEAKYSRDTSIASYLMLKMLQESNVKIMLSTYISGPILENKRITGVLIENKSGRQAVKSKVVIDATGEADLARKGDANIIYPKASYHEMDPPHAPTGMGLCFGLSGIDWIKFDKYLQSTEVSGKDLRWAKETLGDGIFSTYNIHAPQLFPIIRKAWQNGEYDFVHEIAGFGNIVVSPKLFSLERKKPYAQTGIAFTRVSVGKNKEGRFLEEVDAADGMIVSKLEVEVRVYIFETVMFWKKYIPGFEKCELLAIAPYLGARGGPCIEGEYVLTMEDAKSERKFNDVIWVTRRKGESEVLLNTDFEIPYRVMVPPKIDGLLAVGRSASSIPDTLLRDRRTLMHIGQVGGTAAALAARNDISPKELKVRNLQQTLLDNGFIFGEKNRLKELGLEMRTRSESK